MIRADIISNVGREYLTSNIENDEFSYPKAFSAASLTFNPIRNRIGRAFKMDLISNTKVKLPTKSDGTPDFNYMEHYMKSLPYGDRI